jgi:capsular polysaccharide biosynthesis protein
LLLNQEEVLGYLNDNGIPIKKYTMSGMSYIDQVNLFRSARFVMTITGSGPTNQIYCTPGKTKILFAAPKGGIFVNGTLTAKQTGLEYATIEGYENFDHKNGYLDSYLFSWNIQGLDVFTKFLPMTSKLINEQINLAFSMTKNQFATF